MRFCTTCGAQLADGQVFCPSCGTRAAVPEPPTQQLPAQPPVPPPYETPQAGGWSQPEQPAPRRRNVPAIVAAVVLAAIAVGAWGYVISERTGWFQGDDGSTQAVSSERDRDEPPAEQDEEPTEEPEPEPEAAEEPPQEVEPGLLSPASVTADCVAPPAKDSAGATVTYEPEQVLDGEPSTAWRCPGSAVGRRLVFTFDQPVTLLEVGLVPGYDKVDPTDGIDRFTENRTVTGVTWRTDDGSSFPQGIPNPERTMTMLALPEPVTTQVLTLEITATGNDEANRDFTPISDVELYGY